MGKSFKVLLVVVSVLPISPAGKIVGEKVTLRPDAGSNPDGVNGQWSQSTPQGSFNMSITNPAEFGMLAEGDIILGTFDKVSASEASELRSPAPPEPAPVVESEAPAVTPAAATPAAVPAVVASEPSAPGATAESSTNAATPAVPATPDADNGNKNARRGG